MIEIVTKSDAKYLKQIENWLIKEYKSHNTGFYCNWEIIKDSFDSNKMFFLILENKAIGFLTWFGWEKVVYIDIVEIEPTKRMNGFGKEFAQKSLDLFIKFGFLVTRLECAPPESEGFWKKNGFIEMHNVNSRNVHLYQPLISTLINETEKNNDGFTIELWDGEPYETSKKSPKWIWNLVFKENQTDLVNPIIFPCHYDWRIKLSRNKQVIVDNKVKYFSKIDICFGGFLIISKIPIDYVNFTLDV